MRPETGIRYTSLWDNIKLRVACCNREEAVPGKIDVCSGLCSDPSALRVFRWLSELSTAITPTAMSLQITGTELPTVNLYAEMGFICLLRRNAPSVIYSLPRDE